MCVCSQTEGMNQVWVTELEEGEIGEDDAVMAVAGAMCCGSVEIRLAAGGRANLIATEDCCALVDDELLKQINCTSSVVIATVRISVSSGPGERLATIKSAPFAVAQAQLETVFSILERARPHSAGPSDSRRRSGGALHRSRTWDRARTLFENVVRTPAGALRRNSAICAVGGGRRRAGHAIAAASAARSSSAMLVASTTAPAGPEDVIGRAFVRLRRAH